LFFVAETNDIAELKAIILAQQEEIAALRAVISSLEARLSLNSTNSHKPPATAGYAKKPALPKPSGGKVGGQTGHPGKTLEMVEKPDSSQQHWPSQCPICQKQLPQQGTIIARRQVFDLPQPRLKVHEHQLMEARCACGCQVRGLFPESVAAPVQYGPRLLALSSLLNTDYRLPFAKISTLFADLFGYAVNESTIWAANVNLYAELDPVETTIKEALQGSSLIHVDETGLRVKGKLNWLHVACNQALTYLFVHLRRGKAAIDSDQSVLAAFSGWLIHDCWRSYFGLSKARHGLCGAHLIRELQALLEQGSQWASLMQIFLLDAYKSSRDGPIDLDQQAHWQRRYRLICGQGLEEEPACQARRRGRPKQSKGRNLLNRLLEHESAVLAFAFEVGVPFTNNQAERDLRPAKVKQKVSNCFRTESGAAHYARIAGFVSTMRKNKQDVLAQLTNVLSGSFTWKPT
jgi:transposase